MSSRTLHRATAVAGLALALTACGPSGGSHGGSNAAGSPAATASADVTASATASASSAQTDPSAGTGSGDGSSPAAGGAPGDCSGANAQLAAGQKVVVVTRHATAAALYAKDGKFECSQPDFGWWPQGAEKTYPIAATAKATLANDGSPQVVLVSRLVDHIAKCLDGVSDKPTCNFGKNYRITVDASGKITDITEIWGV